MTTLWRRRLSGEDLSRPKSEIAQFITQGEIAHLRAIHPTSDVQALIEMPIALLHETVEEARALYHEGIALSGRHGYRVERLALIAEVLELRARYLRLTPAARVELSAGVRRASKNILCNSLGDS